MRKGLEADLLHQLDLIGCRDPIFEVGKGGLCSPYYYSKSPPLLSSSFYSSPDRSTHKEHLSLAKHVKAQILANFMIEYTILDEPDKQEEAKAQAKTYQNSPKTSLDT